MNWHLFHAITSNSRGKCAIHICTESQEFACANIDRTWFKITQKQLSVANWRWSSNCVHLSLSANENPVQCALVSSMFAPRMKRIDLVSVGYKIKPMRLFVCDCVNVQIKFTCRCWQELRMTTRVSLHLPQAQSPTGQLFRRSCYTFIFAAVTGGFCWPFGQSPLCCDNIRFAWEFCGANEILFTSHTTCLPFKLAFWMGLRWCAVDCAFALLFTLSLYLLVLEYLKMLQFFSSPSSSSSLVLDKHRKLIHLFMLNK